MSNNGVLEQIIQEIVRHDEEHPDHGVGCVCHDKHAMAIRELLSKRLINKHGRHKSLTNLLLVFRYIINNP